MQEKLIIDFISTGDEVLTGEIDDTNASWVSRFLLDQGLLLSRRYTVADNLDDLVMLFNECSLRADIVIVNGGLGPTEDDLSAEAFGRALNRPLQMFDSWVEQMRLKYERMGRPMSAVNLKQALLPEGIDIIDNPVGTACGFAGNLNRARFYFTPGVPHEFKQMMATQIWPDLSQRFDIATTKQVRRYFTYGYGESDLVDFLKPLALPESIVLGYRAAMPFIEIKLTAEPSPVLEEKCLQLQALLGERLLYKGESSLASVIQQAMVEKNLKLALAESCTGGLAASMLVAEAGSSSYFERGFVSYSCEAKHQLLGVTWDDINQHGAVSEVVAAAMAEGALRNSNADIALSVTGVAGPDNSAAPNGAELPAGHVIFALARKGQSTVAMSCQFRYRSRNQLRTMAAVFVLDMLRRHLQGLPVKSDLSYVI